jgi:hypothetical protein
MNDIWAQHSTLSTCQKIGNRMLHSFTNRCASEVKEEVTIAQSEYMKTSNIAVVCQNTTHSRKISLQVKMSSNNNEHRDLASCLNKDVLKATLEAGSYEPNNLSAERPAAYEIDIGDESFSPPGLVCQLFFSLIFLGISANVMFRARAAPTPATPASKPPVPSTANAEKKD